MKFKVSSKSKEDIKKKLLKQQQEDKEFKELCKLLETVVASWKK